jgi:micrococcal nuclease
VTPSRLLDAGHRRRRRGLCGGFLQVSVALCALGVATVLRGPLGAHGESRMARVALPCDAADPTTRTVVRVVDGDTIVLDGQEKVRLIGVDTPELHHPTKPVQYFAREAAAFTTQHLEGKTVHLAYDWQRQDRYRRTLAYVCLDGELVNETIVRDGFGFAYVKYPFTAALMERFRAAEQQARDAGRGLWASLPSVPQKETPSP